MRLRKELSKEHVIIVAKTQRGKITAVRHVNNTWISLVSKITFPILLKTPTTHCIQTTFRKLPLSSLGELYTTLCIHEVSKAIAFFFIWTIQHTIYTRRLESYCFLHYMNHKHDVSKAIAFFLIWTIQRTIYTRRFESYHFIPYTNHTTYYINSTFRKLLLSSLYEPYPRLFESYRFLP